MPQNDRVEDTLQKILDKLTEHTIILERHSFLHEQNTKDLTHHIKRTDLLEETLEETRKALEKDFKDKHEKLEKDVEEAVAPFRAIKTLAKYAGYITAIGSAIALFIAIIKHFKG